MSESPRLIGLEMSPYSVKVRSYLRYKEIPFQWISRNGKAESLFREHARVNLIPLLLFSDGTAMQDSTLIIETLESRYPDPAIHPDEPAACFISALLEEFGDEWCNKLMFQYRWGPDEDARSSAQRIAAEAMSGFPRNLLRPFIPPLMVRRMKPRMAFAGANETNAPHLQASWIRTIEILEEHLQARHYLFGERPAFGDFGMWGNLYQASTDPTCGRHLQACAPNVLNWIEQMKTPRPLGDFEPLDSLLPTLSPLLKEQVADRFLAWSLANARAWRAEEPETALAFEGRPYRQKTFKYHAWSLGQLKKKLVPVAGDPLLIRVLGDTGCAPLLDEATAG